MVNVISGRNRPAVCECGDVVRQVLNGIGEVGVFKGASGATLNIPIPVSFISDGQRQWKVIWVITVERRHVIVRNMGG